MISACQLAEFLPLVCVCLNATDPIDRLIIDEAGQMALADAVATAAPSIVLLGDPQQLPQVSQGTHPEGASASVLEHVLDAKATIAPERGLFLDASWRMHPTSPRSSASASTTVA